MDFPSRLGGTEVEHGRSLRPFTTLRAGGKAQHFASVRNHDQLAAVACEAQSGDLRLFMLGSGSNVLPADAGVPGLTVLNRCRETAISSNGTIIADTGIAFQDLFLRSAQASLSGLEFAVGIPGTLGGALVSNAGAYRSNIADLLKRLEIVFEGRRQWVDPAYMQFSYRDSILRGPKPPSIVVVRVELQLEPAKSIDVYDTAREIQRQRILKQPPQASAGSFFKNVNDHALACRLESLPASLRDAGVVPAGYLIEGAGLKGFRLGGAMLGQRHANFILNVGGAAATNIRRLAEYAKSTVMDRFGVTLEEEVLYVGNWHGWDRSR